MKYDRTYFEEGVARGVSCYTNYTWLPEVSFPLAHRIIQRLNIRPGAKVLDWGCAKGYLVKALRMLDVDAWGCDVSQYALDASPSDTRPFLCRVVDPECPTILPLADRSLPQDFQWVIAKDTLEHMTEPQLDVFLQKIACYTGLYAVIPLGNGKRYNIPQYEQDVTHVLRQPLKWWLRKLGENGWHAALATNDVRGIKNSWAHYHNGNAVICAYRHNVAPPQLGCKCGCHRGIDTECCYL